MENAGYMYIIVAWKVRNVKQKLQKSFNSALFIVGHSFIKNSNAFSNLG